jgi:protein-S-isoprenylcysteine O-methyltransferase Ste14
VILLLVPVMGVRGGLEHLVLNWQELVLFTACLATSIIGGARALVIGVSEHRGSRLIEETKRKVPSNEIEPAHSQPACAHTVEEELLVVSRRPTRQRLVWSREGKTRARHLGIFAYLALYVNCAVLCQKLNLGSIAADLLVLESIRSTGLCLSIVGLYLVARGLFRRQERDVSPGETQGDAVSPGLWGKAPHVPPTRLNFLVAHPVCAGWLVLLAGIPLVFQAWFPLVALPGIFVGMNWLFRDGDQAITRGDG